MRRLHPYVPGEQRGENDVVKLNTNENPYAPSIGVLNAIREISNENLRKYPDPESTELRSALAKYQGVSIDEVYVGNGSDELLGLAFMAFFTDAPLQYPQLSYSFYPVYCDLFGIEKQEIELASDYSVNLDGFEKSIGGLVFPNPNAPTGLAVSSAQIESLLIAHAESVVLVDEAYADFGADSAIELIHKYPNLLVVQTFSKGRSLAGLRVGAVYGNRDLIEGIKRVKNSFNSYPVDAVAQRAALASLQDESYYRTTIDRIVKTREATIDALSERKFKVLPSVANFVFASPEDGAAEALFEYLSSKNILVRHWNTPALNKWLRISIGTDTQMRRLVEAIDSYHEAL